MDAIDEEQTRIGCHGLRIPGWRDRVQVKLRDVYACNLGRRGLKLVSKSNINTLNSSPVSCLPLKIYILFFSSPLEHSTLSIVTIFSFFLYEKKKKRFSKQTVRYLGRGQVYTSISNTITNCISVIEILEIEDR